MKPQEPLKTAVIRHNDGMIRDLILKSDRGDVGHVVLSVRQTKFKDDGTVISKALTFTETEMEEIIAFWRNRK